MLVTKAQPDAHPSSEGDRGSRTEAPTQQAAASLARALELNRWLRREYEPLLQQAQRAARQGAR